MNEWYEHNDHAMDAHYSTSLQRHNELYQRQGHIIQTQAQIMQRHDEIIEDQA